LTNDSQLFSWGYNDEGELGDNTLESRNSPTQVYKEGVLNGKKIIQVSSSIYHNLALSDSGEVFSWGYNDAGELGDSTFLLRKVFF
jgi:alpha-tubulin suppressor-like RCC1 family protein